MARELDRLGHEVTLFADEPGRLAERAAADLRRQVRELAARGDALSADRDAWQARALEAERQVGDTRGLMATRRVRAGLALGRCRDRLRTLR